MKKLLLILTTIPTLSFSINLDNYFNSKNCSQIVNKGIYKSCYDYNLKGTKAVAYSVDGTKLADAEVHIKKRPSFYAENDLPVKYRSFPEDYTHSGYDRGHMANHADFDYSANLVYQTYSMSNIVPQNPDVNRKTWVKAEKYERNVAKSYGKINVVNIVYYSNNPQRIGKHQVAVPDYFVKVIYSDDNKFEKCFKYDNSNPIDLSNDKLKDYEINCSNI